MPTARFSWKGVAAVVLSSVVVSTADQLFAQLNTMGDSYRAAAPLPGGDAWKAQGENAAMGDVRDGVPQSSPILGQPQPVYQMRPYEQATSYQAPAGGAVPYDSTSYPSGTSQMPFGNDVVVPSNQHPDLAYPSDMPLVPAAPLPEFREMQPSVGMPSEESVVPQPWEPIEGMQRREERMALPQLATSSAEMRPSEGDDATVVPVATPEPSSAPAVPARGIMEEMMAMPPAQPESDAMPPVVDSATQEIIQNREIIENLATQLGHARGENARLQQEIDGLRSIVQQLQDTIASLSSASLPLHDAADEMPADRAMMRGDDAQNAVERSDAGREAGMPEEPVGAEPETGVFGKVLNWFGF